MSFTEDPLSPAQLRRQQLRLGILLAARTLLTRQGYLRQILTQPRLTEALIGEVTPAPGGTDGEEVNAELPPGPTLLIQQLMQAATQPSPIKAIFPREELEVST